MGVLTFIAVLVTLGATSCSSRLVSTDRQRTTDVAVPYYLPKGLLHIKVSRRNGRLELKCDGIVYRPDPEQQYYLNYHPSLFSDDEVTVVIDETGLLTSVQAQAEDQSSGFVSKVVNLVRGVATSGAAPEPRAGEPAPLPEFEYESAFDPLMPAERDIVRNELEALGVLAEFEHPVPLNPNLIAGEASSKCPATADVCFRPAVPYRFKLTISEGSAGGARVGRDMTILLPNEAPALGLDVERYAFVKGSTKLAFGQGMLTGVVVNKPSEAVGFMDIPLSIARGILSLPGEIMRVQVSSAQEETSLLNAQRSLIEAQTNLVAQQQRALEAEKQDDK